MAEHTETPPQHQVNEQDKFIVPQAQAGDRKSQSDFAPEYVVTDSPPIVVSEEGGKQVVHGQWTKPALEVDRQQPKFPVDFEGHPGGIEVASAPPTSTRDSRVLGLEKRTFWVVFAVLVVVIFGGAIGGGVGGGIVARRKNEAAGAAASQTTESTGVALAPSSP